MLAALRRKLRMNEPPACASAEKILFYLGTHGITILLLTVLLLGVIFLE